MEDRKLDVDWQRSEIRQVDLSLQRIRANAVMTEQPQANLKTSNGALCQGEMNQCLVSSRQQKDSVMQQNSCGLTRGPELSNSKFYMGNLMSFLLNGSDTAGRFAIVDGVGKIGNEPPPHYHDWEDEIYFVLGG